MTLIYRMTHIDNLPLLLQWGGDYSANQCLERNANKRAIHNTDITDKRQTKRVDCPVGGSLADYVPFYFRYRSPMLYAIKGGNVKGYLGEQREVIYLQSSAQKIAAADIPFAFTNGHALKGYAEFYHNLGDLDKAPWEAARAKYWHDIFDGGFQCQAEFLVRDFFAFALCT